jgi:predicted RNA-binding protein YlxR (DUF448 family)
LREKAATQPDSNPLGEAEPNLTGEAEPSLTREADSGSTGEAGSDSGDEADPATDPHKGPLRRCLVTRESHARETMLRFVVGPDAELVFDAPATLPGRGMWLSASGVVVEQALKRAVFPRAAKTQLRIPPDLRGLVETLLRNRLVELLGLARRSGNAIAGFEKGREWLASGKAGLIVQAVDGSPEERARFAGNKKTPVAAVLSAAALGRIFGREHAVHTVIADGRLARMIEVEAVRLQSVAAASPSGQ